jgi:hydroxyacylglutathione hydrolase
VIVERSMHPGWLSNAYLIGDEPRGTAIFVDSGAPLGPLFEAVERHGLNVTHLLTTHADADHIAGDDEIRARYGCPIVKGDLETGGLSVRALETPGHKDDHLAFVVKALARDADQRGRAGFAGTAVSNEVCCSGDVLFKDAVGGGDFGQIRRSVMDVLMKLPPETRVLPGHTDETTIGGEWEHNPFVRVWRGAEPEGSERVRVGGEQATLIVWSPDYDGKGKAWVRFDDGRDAIIGGSRVQRK